MHAATKRTDSALPGEVELLQATLDLVPSGVVTIDAGANILTSNARFFDMLKHAGLIVTPFSSLSNKQLTGCVLTEIAPALLNQPEEVAVSSSRKFLFTYVDAVDGSDGGTVLINDVIAKPISDEVEGNSQEREDSIELAKTAFVSQVAHHFRTPLNVILGYVGIMTAQGSRMDPDIQTTYLDFIRESASALLLNMNEMMDIIRLQRREQPVELENRELSSLVTEVVSETHSVLQDEAVILETGDLIDTIGTTRVVMDVRLARRALAGLVRTCAVLSGQGSSLKMSAERLDDDQKIKVSLDFLAGRSDVASIIDSIEKGEPIKEISLTGNASGYGIVLAAVLLKLCEVEITATEHGEKEVSISMVFQQVSAAKPVGSQPTLAW